MDNSITLGGFLSVLESTKPITINLMSEEGLLIITFIKDGYSALEDTIESATIKKIVLKNLNTIDVTIETTNP